MSLFGKILALFNVFGALALVVLATMDYGKRQAWAYSVFRHDLALKGLPVDAEEKDARGHPIVNHLSKKTVDDLFAHAGGNGVTTQAEEVTRLKSLFDAKLGEMNGQDGKPLVRQQTYFLARTLLPLTDTYLQREELLACRHYFASDAALAALKARYQAGWNEALTRAAEVIDKTKPPMSFEEAMHMAMRAQRGEASDVFTTTFLAPLPSALAQVKAVKFDDAWNNALASQLKSLKDRTDSRFARALIGPNMPAAPAQAADIQKRDIARLLFGLCQPLAEAAPEAEAALKGVAPGTADYATRLANSEPYRKSMLRVYVVCGLKTTLSAIGDEAESIRKLADAARKAQDQDLSTFLADNTALVEELRDRAEMVRIEEARVKDNTTKLTSHQALVKKRKEDVTEFRGRLDTSRAETKVETDNLRKSSDAVLKLRLEVRDDIRKMEEAERKIRELEALIRSRERSQSQK